ncbi:sugar kinase [Streptomyces sp. NPDC059861]|uniref:sugar kinase n=1 Tax=Streptomyces sp. NPDC059861 TaxID=3346974 RepID=UPI003657A479
MVTANGPCTAPDVVDVVALGESMVTFLPSRPGRLADVPSFARGIGGAESNVACVLAAAGHATRWVSRVGEDGFGDHLVEAIGAYGVDVSAVRRDPARPTGVYFRTAGDRAGDGHEVAYYRAGSAASAMTVENVDMAAIRAARVLHLSGITAALSADCLRLLRELTAPAAGRPLISFDVNHRPGLWRDADGARVLLELARRADIVFVGEDEAEEAWGVTGGAAAIRALLPEPAVLVVKDGARGATVFENTAPRTAAAGAPPPPPHTTEPAPAPAPKPGAVRDGAAGAPVSGRAGDSGGAVVPGRADDVAGAPVSWRAGDSGGAGGRADDGGGAVVSGGAGDVGGWPGPSATGSSAAGTPPADAGVTQSAPGHASGAAPAMAPGRGAAVTFVPAPAVVVAAAVGAGDAFAAGFLSATLRNLPTRDRLRHGHLMAAAALTVPGDLATPPTRDHADRLAALDDDAWGTLRLGPGWTHAVDRAPEEVRTP